MDRYALITTQLHSEATWWTDDHMVILSNWSVAIVSLLVVVVTVLSIAAVRRSDKARDVSQDHFISLQAASIDKLTKALEEEITARRVADDRQAKKDGE